MFAAIRHRALIAFLLTGAPAALAADLGTINEAEIDKVVASVVTSDAERNVIRRRLTGWKELQASGKNKTLAEPEKLRLENDFMDETPFYCDPVMWCLEDFWTK